MREHLIGYLLGALDASEQKRVEDELQRDPGLREELELLSRSLSPLEADLDGYSPPDGLADQTIEFVAAFSDVGFGDLEEADDFHKIFDEEDADEKRDASEREPAPSPTRAAFEAAPSPPARRSWFTLADAMVSTGVCMIAAALFFPAILQSRSQAQIAACGYNLQNLGKALASYADFHQGNFPMVPDEGRFGIAGSYSLILREQGYITDDESYLCPADERPRRLPLRAEMLQAEGATLREMQRLVGGSYGYNLGVIENGQRQPIRNLGRSNFALMADSPSVRLGGRQSAHHGDRGQNVLFENGSVRFVRGNAIDERDDFYRSDRDLIEAGRHLNDSVVGRSDSTPVLIGR